ncbi:PspC domain-containing protein [Rhodococcus sp. Z13]|uniref:PspC domain-containing protein n=1 Tax=Rhodococcus sacchari TaxID=2962047 RepID=A0ACD4DE30_9NOCA|nr:PspC domain-containing protein [Rhodococcus sp. Z13]UYP18247.1 PspC domain-containing protein [Rhodococcus sp. Z13]
MNFESETPRPFTRSSSQRMLGGVCGGLAEYFRVDVNLVRAGTVLAGFVSGGGAALLYLALWMLIPEH